ncbi:6205_t:CDS:2 [Dentiscutata heterogama]|uniref:6205_t:CDS:1 n=1 Tax=Dentiscutata heterogama TaxID=1316150 RepID=A0ACA9KN03_9GLOM|nr:6205_t:CDS:2 [Dentiscutata heterogama]
MGFEYRNDKNCCVIKDDFGVEYWYIGGLSMNDVVCNDNS